MSPFLHLALGHHGALPRLLQTFAVKIIFGKSGYSYILIYDYLPPDDRSVIARARTMRLAKQGGKFSKKTKMTMHVCCNI